MTLIKKQIRGFSPIVNEKIASLYGAIFSFTIVYKNIINEEYNYDVEMKVEMKVEINLCLYK